MLRTDIFYHDMESGIFLVYFICLLMKKWRTKTGRDMLELVCLLYKLEDEEKPHGLWFTIGMEYSVFQGDINYICFLLLICFLKMRDLDRTK